MKQISIGSWAYSIGPYADNPVPFDEVIKRLKEMNFDGVELGGFPPHPNPDDLPDRESREQLKQKLNDVGLKFSGLAANLWAQKLINTDDPEPYINEFRKNLDFCVDLGIPAIRVDTVQPPTIFEEVDYDTAKKRVVETWTRCTKEAADKGVYVTWEFEPGFAFNKPSDIFRILEEIPDDNFGVQLDTCHAHGGEIWCPSAGAEGNPARRCAGTDSKLNGRINHIHLIDSDGTLHDDETSTHTPFFEGELNFDELVPALNQVGVRHNWWTIDLCFWPNAWDVTRQCKDGIDQLNQKYGG